MTMNKMRENMIADLTADLEPVKQFSSNTGLVWMAAATIAASVVSIAFFSFWFGMFEGEASAFFWVTNGLLLLLGSACALALVISGSPRVGGRANAPEWTLAMAAIVPIAAIISMVSNGHVHEGLSDPVAFHCVSSSLASAALVGIVSVLWLRRGAPVAIERSAWLVGVTAGALGTVAFGVTCGLDSVSHLGLWHTAPVAIAAIVGRLVVPPLIRW
ncbi:MAG: DUF1109 domain-containing protein [Erythrobacter sp.]